MAPRGDPSAMVTIVLFDDNQHNLAELRKQVERQFPQGTPYTILEASSYDELMRILATSASVDILITDIVTPEGEPSGIEVVQRLFPPESGTQVIYTSGYLEQATEVYQTNHLYFLLKPIDPAKLRDALAKATSALTHRVPKMLRIKVGRRDQLVNVATITYLESSLHKVTVHTRVRDFETYARLDELQAQLPTSFSRCHRSYLVNLSCVSSLDESVLTLHDGTTLPVSRRRMRQVQHDLLAYVSLRPKA